MHTVDRFAKEGWSNYDQLTYLMRFVSVGKKHTIFEWKDEIFLFLISQGSAAASVKWGGRVQHPIAHFLSNISAKRLLKRLMLVPFKAKECLDLFWDTE